MTRVSHAAAQMRQEFARPLTISGADAVKARADETAGRAAAGYGTEIASLDGKA